jgi:hypothetical protein
MAKRKSLLSGNSGKLAGVQKDERTMSALPIRIDYQYPQIEHVCTAVGTDFRFSPISRGISPTLVEYGQHLKMIRRTNGHNLDPFAVRNEFVAVNDVPSALRFLSQAGTFWPFHYILWSQFQEWQRFFYWLRQPYETAIQSPEGARVWQAAQSGKDQFFTQVQPYSPEEMQEIGHEELRKMEVAGRQSLFHLRRFALWPGRASSYCVSIEWHEVGDETFKRCPPTKSFKGRDQKPFLNIEAHNVIEAIAATIYADRSDGIAYEACKHCRKLFTVESDHGQEFCPRPAWLRSSPCKNAYQAQARRDQLKAGRPKQKAQHKAK